MPRMGSIGQAAKLDEARLNRSGVLCRGTGFVSMSVGTRNIAGFDAGWRRVRLRSAFAQIVIHFRRQLRWSMLSPHFHRDLTMLKTHFKVNRAFAVCAIAGTSARAHLSWRGV